MVHFSFMPYLPYTVLDTDLFSPLAVSTGEGGIQFQYLTVKLQDIAFSLLHRNLIILGRRCKTLVGGCECGSVVQ